MSPSLNATLSPTDIERVGIGSTYLTQQETRDFTRREYVPVWPPAGQDVLDIARAEALEIIGKHKPAPLPDGALEKIKAIVAEADTNLGDL